MTKSGPALLPDLIPTLTDERYGSFYLDDEALAGQLNQRGGPASRGQTLYLDDSGGSVFLHPEVS